VNRLNIISNVTPANAGMTEFFNTASGVAIFANNSSTTNGFSAIEGTTNGANGVAVNGIHRPDQGIGFHGTGIGTRGVTNSYNGIGIYGSSPGNWLTHNGAAVFANGDIVWTGNAYSPSDRRLKKNIKNSENLLENVLDLKVYSYDFDTTVFRLNNGVESQIGFIAQDLQEIFPELVAKKNLYSRQTASGNLENGSNTESEEFLTVNYIGLIPILTKAIQEQQTKIKTLEQRIEALENAISE
jgi:hypothetical protein